jgi:uncharacterized membrane protein
LAEAFETRQISHPSINAKSDTVNRPKSKSKSKKPSSPFSISAVWVLNNTRTWLRSLSGVGLALGFLFFAASLTPTLIPRTYFMQGVLAGACLGVGYALGVFWRWLWRYLELPEPSTHTRFVVNCVVTAAGAGIALYCLAMSAAWQNSIRSAMNMTPVDTAHPIKLSIVALLAFFVLLLLTRLFLIVTRYLTELIRIFIPRRIANVIAIALTAIFFWSIGNNLLFHSILSALDSSYRRFDALIEPDSPRPTEASKTGSVASLVRWEELGRAGREFVASSPSAQEIAAFTGRPARQPIRVYVGLRGAETAAQRAALALDELKRQGGFERSVLVVITPTGTGWIDPSAMGPVEYLHDGNIASVAVQYSYLSSPLSLLVQPEYGDESARALFAAIYKFWTTLPKDERPKLYLHGLSLGSFNSEKSIELFETIGDPIQGAVWSGPPFANRIRQSVTANRNADSPAWRPTFRDSRIVRFMNQNGPAIPNSAPWGPLRVVYLQYASDAIALFGYRYAFRSPDWMNAPRGSDVSHELHWYPLVTMLQLAADMAFSTTTPMGVGHVYAPEHYVDAWLAVTDVRHWSPDRIATLKSHLARIARLPVEHPTPNEAPYNNRGG